MHVQLLILWKQSGAQHACNWRVATWSACPIHTGRMQVHINIFADGPTRVVRFTDSGEGMGLEDGIIAAWRRVRTIEQQLSIANQRFAALRGGAGLSRLDLFGSAVPREVMADTLARPSSSASALPPPVPDAQRALSVAPSGRLRQRTTGSGSAVTAPVAAVVMMLAGELTVSVVTASGVNGNLLLRLQVEQQQQHTTVLWNSSDPSWDEPFTFSEVCRLSFCVCNLCDRHRGGGACNPPMVRGQCPCAYSARHNSHCIANFK